jgi:alpha-tubulin suppressor-like RCC1 family protein
VSFEQAGQNRVEQMAFDIGHVCVRMTDGTVRCMGENTHGELGNARRGEVLREPVPLRGLGRLAEVLVGRRLTCGRRRDGTVRCLGSPEGGQLGTGGAPSPDERGVVLPVQGLTGATQLSTSLGTVCALVRGTLQCWGREFDVRPTVLAGLSGVAEFDLEGLFHGCARFTDGTVRCGRFAREVPVTGATQLDAGATHACARLEDGTVRCWGFNSSGQLGGQAPGSDTYTPVDPGLRCVVQVVVGGDHSCALLTDGTVRCWGGNHFGQLGTGDTTDRPSPAPVAGVMNAVRIFAGPGTSCAFLEEGDLRCWGQSLWLPGAPPSVFTRPTEVRW